MPERDNPNSNPEVKSAEAAARDRAWTKDRNQPSLDDARKLAETARVSVKEFVNEGSKTVVKEGRAAAETGRAGFATAEKGFATAAKEISRFNDAAKEFGVDRDAILKRLGSLGPTGDVRGTIESADEAVQAIKVFRTLFAGDDPDPKKAEAQRKAALEQTRNNLQEIVRKTYGAAPEAVSTFIDEMRRGVKTSDGRRSPVKLDEAARDAVGAGIKALPFAEAESHFEQSIAASNRGDRDKANLEYAKAIAAWVEETANIVGLIEGAEGLAESAPKAPKAPEAGADAAGRTRVDGARPKDAPAPTDRPQKLADDGVDRRPATAAERDAADAPRAARSPEAWRSELERESAPYDSPKAQEIVNHLDKEHPDLAEWLKKHPDANHPEGIRNLDRLDEEAAKWRAMSKPEIAAKYEAVKGQLPRIWNTLNDAHGIAVLAEEIGTEAKAIREGRSPGPNAAELPAETRRLLPQLTPETRATIKVAQDARLNVETIMDFMKGDKFFQDHAAQGNSYLDRGANGGLDVGPGDRHGASTHLFQDILLKRNGIDPGEFRKQLGEIEKYSRQLSGDRQLAGPGERPRPHIGDLLYQALFDEYVKRRGLTEPENLYSLLRRRLPDLQ